MVTEDRAERVRQELQQAKDAGAKVTRVAEETGLSRAGIYKVLRGEGEHYESTLDALENWLLQRRARAEPRVVRERSTRPPYVTVPPTPYDPEADVGMDLFRDWDAAQVHYAGIGPPGTARARKRMAWETGTAMAQHFGWDLPDWWYDIPEKIDAGEI